MKNSKRKRSVHEIPLRHQMDDVYRFFLYTVMIESGIIPIESHNTSFDKILKNYSQEEQRKLKRKFRKLWRKYYRHQLKKSSVANKELRDNAYQATYGIGNKKPSKIQKMSRKKLVWENLWIEKILPLVDMAKEIKRD